MSNFGKWWKANQVAAVTGVLVLLVVAFPVGSYLKAQVGIDCNNDGLVDDFEMSNPCGGGGDQGPQDPMNDPNQGPQDPMNDPNQGQQDQMHDPCPGDSCPGMCCEGDQNMHDPCPGDSCPGMCCDDGNVNQGEWCDGTQCPVGDYCCQGDCSTQPCQDSNNQTGGERCGNQPNGASNYCADNDYCADASRGWCCQNGQEVCSDGMCVWDMSDCGSDSYDNYYNDDRYRDDRMEDDRYMDDQYMQDDRYMDNMHQAPNDPWSGGVNYADFGINSGRPDPQGCKNAGGTWCDGIKDCFPPEANCSMMKTGPMFDFNGPHTCDPRDPFCNDDMQMDRFESKWDDYMKDDYDTKEMNTKEASRELKMIQREVKNESRWLQDVNREFKKLDWTIQSPVLVNAKSMLDEIKGIFADIEGVASVSTRGDIEQLRDKLDYFRNDLRPDFDDLRPQLHVFEELKNFNKEVARMLKDVTREKARFEKDKASDECVGYLTDAEAALLAVQEDPLANLDTEYGFDPRDLWDQMEEIRWDYMEPAFECQGNSMKDKWEGKKINKDDMLGMYDDDIAAIIEAKILAKMSEIDQMVNAMVNQVMNRAMEQMAAVIEKVSDQVATKMTRMTESMTYANEAVQEKAAEAQGEVYETVEEVSAVAENLSGDAKKEVEEVMDDFASELWTEETADELKPQVAGLVDLIENGATTTEIVEEAKEIQGLIADAKKDEQNKRYAEGFVPFKDTNPDDWFMGYAHKGKELGHVTGEGGTNNLNPGGELLGAHEVVILAREAGVDKDCTEPLKAVPGMVEWAKSAVCGLQQKYGAGVLDSIDRPLDQPIRRVDVVEVQKAVLNLATPTNVDEILADNFKDVSGLNQSEKEAVAAAYNAGVVKGDDPKTAGDKRTFRPDDGMNRAEGVKVNSVAHEIATQ